MADWSGNRTYNKIRYDGREIHLQGLFRGFSIERQVGVNPVQRAYYFLGNPHGGAAYANPSQFYEQLLASLSTRWGNAGVAPTGNVNAPHGTANYRGTTLDSIWRDI